MNKLVVDELYYISENDMQREREREKERGARVEYKLLKMISISHQTLGTSISAPRRRSADSSRGRNSLELSTLIINSPVQSLTLAILGSLQKARAFSSVPANSWGKKNKKKIINSSFFLKKTLIKKLCSYTFKAHGGKFFNVLYIETSYWNKELFCEWLIIITLCKGHGEWENFNVLGSNVYHPQLATVDN